MTGRTKLWRVAGALFALINVAGAVFALVTREPIHAAVHVGLLFLGMAYVVWRLAPRNQLGDLPPHKADARLDYLQQSVDAMALEVERLGEAQRFSDKLRAERGETSPLKKPPEV